MAAWLLASIVGCATSYEPVEDRVDLRSPGSEAISPDSPAKCCGYSEVQLSPTIVRVSFLASSSTRREAAEDFALLRSAEVALLRGHRYFVIRDRVDYTEVQTQTNSIPVYEGQGESGRWSTATSTKTVQLPKYENTIELFMEHPPENYLFVYDAAFVQRAIRYKHGLEGAPLVSGDSVDDQ